MGGTVCSVPRAVSLRLLKNWTKEVQEEEDTEEKDNVMEGTGSLGAGRPG